MEANTSGAFIAQLDQSEQHAIPTNTHYKNISSCQNRGGEKIKECLCESESPRTGANVVPVNYRLQFFKENSPVVSKLLLMSAREREGRRHYLKTYSQHTASNVSKLCIMYPVSTTFLPFNVERVMLSLQSAPSSRTPLQLMHEL